MTKRTGIARFTLLPIGTFRLDDSGLHLVSIIDNDDSITAGVEALLERANLDFSGPHLTPEEAIERLPRLAGLPRENIVGLTITGGEPIPLPPEGAVF
jgi:hypothetical protein